MKKLRKKFVTLILTVAIITSMNVTAFAHDFPQDVSSNSYIEFTVPFSFDCYTNPELTIRGSNGEAYNTACVSTWDTIKIVEITKNYVKFYYPVGKNWKLAYAKTSTVFGSSIVRDTVISSVKVTTYINPDGKATGYISPQDDTYLMGEKGESENDKWYLTIYRASKGDREFKAAFIRKSDWEKMTASSANTSSNTSKRDMSYALYQNTGGRLTCGFNGYQNTTGSHEGSDFVRSYGSPIYSLTAGVVTRVTEGRNGSGGLSTIAIYDAANNKTVVYLHSDPLNSLFVGQSISVGQQIGFESYRGISNKSSSHTHVEVRQGRKTSAAKSVNDYTLENQDPTAYWQQQGYSMK